VERRNALIDTPAIDVHPETIGRESQFGSSRETRDEGSGSQITGQPPGRNPTAGPKSSRSPNTTDSRHETRSFFYSEDSLKPRPSRAIRTAVRVHRPIRYREPVHPEKLVFRRARPLSGQVILQMQGSIARDPVLSLSRLTLHIMTSSVASFVVSAMRWWALAFRLLMAEPGSDDLVERHEEARGRIQQ
jgi:hypothetical protein